MAKTGTTKKKADVTLAEVVMVYLKSSSHWYALTNPEIVTIEGIKFIAGKQVTGKERHRMEGKRTLIPFEHVASIIEFKAEEELWSEPQPKNLPAPPDASQQSVPLTSHEQAAQGHQRPQHGGSARNRPHGKNRNHDARLQGQYDYNRNRGGFNR